ncbi:MAG: GNAT family N-acetyltransferase, partial [Actinomycetota bacterium]|nr:GNAT family N-acetyltransferase [Actinomycetota bacterium]
LHFRAVLSRMPLAAVEALVDRLAGQSPDLPGVMADAATAAAFAGQWAERRRTPATPVEGQRLYRLAVLRPPVGVPGHLRQATHGERSLLVRWGSGFMEETGGHPLSPEEIVDRHLGSGGLWVWEDGGPVSMAAVSPPVAGVARIGYVYTPRERRRHGYAGACVAAVSQGIRAGGSEAVLFTQLQNPSSNAVYRRIGYEPAVELVIYRFG